MMGRAITRAGEFEERHSDVLARSDRDQRVTQVPGTRAWAFGAGDDAEIEPHRLSGRIGHPQAEQGAAPARCRESLELLLRTKTDYQADDIDMRLE